jgi:hypothetical protein
MHYMYKSLTKFGMIKFLKPTLVNTVSSMLPLSWLTCILLLSGCNSAANADVEDINPAHLEEEILNLEQEDSPEISTAYDQIIALYGNPGVGKSSLCNAIFQQSIFRSGISVGGGMNCVQKQVLGT